MCTGIPQQKLRRWHRIIPCAHHLGSIYCTVVQKSPKTHCKTIISLSILTSPENSHTRPLDGYPGTRQKWPKRVPGILPPPPKSGEYSLATSTRQRTPIQYSHKNRSISSDDDERRPVFWAHEGLFWPWDQTAVSSVCLAGNIADHSC